jgi:Na+-transporting NADH:ubiquinone oxidoreductase subunit A
LIRTRLGAFIGELIAGEIEAPAGCRIISGSPLTGWTAPVEDLYLGRYHNQVSVIREGGHRRLFGWLGLPPSTYTASATFLKRSGQRRKHALDTGQNGRPSGILPLRVFEKVMPLDILPSMLLRALAVGDTDQAQALGCLELDEEDLALCSFVCPAKSDFGAWLRASLDQIRRTG